MARVIIEGFDSVEEAQAFVSAYEGGVEQTMAEWSDNHDTNFPWRTDMQAFGAAKRFCKVEGEDVTIKLTK
jgi:hypothetical protein